MLSTQPNASDQPGEGAEGPPASDPSDRDVSRSTGQPRGPRGLPRWAIVAFAAFAGAAVAAAGVGWYAEGTISEWRAYSDGLAAERDHALDDLDVIGARLTQTEADVAAEGLLLDAESTRLDRREIALDDRESALTEREEAVGFAEERLLGEAITDGTWAIGWYFAPGTYVTEEEAGSYCRWTIYSSPGSYDTVESHRVAGGRPEVTLEAGQEFYSHSCGTWIRQS